MDALPAAEMLSIAGMAVVCLYATWRVHLQPLLHKRRVATNAGA